MDKKQLTVDSVQLSLFHVFYFNSLLYFLQLVHSCQSTVNCEMSAFSRHGSVKTRYGRCYAGVGS